MHSPFPRLAAIQKPNITNVNQRSAQMVSLATHGRWSPGHLATHGRWQVAGATHGRWWESPGEELEQILAAGTFERMELEQLQEYPRDSQRAAVDQR